MSRCAFVSFFFASLWALSALAAGHMNLAQGGGPQQCAHLEMAADRADCDGSHCRLDGHAQVRCDALTLWADSIEVLINPDRSFNGAVAHGNGLLVEGSKVMRCQEIVLQADRVQAQVDSATLEVRRSEGGPLDANGVPVGRNQAVLHGHVERLSKDHIKLHEADITLCDCGEGEPPSWRFDGSEIDAVLGERLTVWWPLVRINPFGLGLIPITPPLAPLSLPLTKRAQGFLPPEWQLFNGGPPTIDLPYFVPLGDSWDVRLTPGLRTDWGTWRRPFGIHTVGAPRLGARVRYAPWVGTTGTLTFQLTHDGARGMANNVRATDLLAGADVNTPQYQYMDAQRRALVDRMSLDWQHRTHLQEGVDWVVDARWVSDDLVNSDFLLAINERLASYIASRSEVAWRTPFLGALLAADMMLRLDNSALGPNGGPPPQPNETALPLYSNTGGAERGTLHRGPFLGVQSSALPLWGGLAGDAGLSFVRYGTWTGATPHNASQADAPQVATQHMLGGTLGLSFNRPVGPLYFAARAGADSVFVNTAESRANFLDTAFTLGADLDLRLAGRHGDTLHVLQPRLAYRSLAAHWGPTGSPATSMASTMAAHLDERFKRQVAHQAMLVLHQSLWQGKPQAQRVGSLDIGQPIDLMTGALLQPWAQLSWGTLNFGSGALWTSLDPRNLRKVPELAANWGYSLSAVGVNASYERYAPDADRFRRSIYELAAPRLPPTPPAPPAAPDVVVDSTWSHLARVGASLRLGGLFDASYGATIQLPRPGQQGGEPACLNTVDLGKSPRPLAPNVCVTQHTVNLHYTSPCDCWGLTAMFSALPQERLPNGLRFQLLFDVGGYRLGTNAGGH